MKVPVYLDILHSLRFSTLKARSLRRIMIEVYKIMTGKELGEKEQFFEISDEYYEVPGRNLKVNKDRSRLEIRSDYT